MSPSRARSIPTDSPRIRVVAGALARTALGATLLRAVVLLTALGVISSLCPRPAQGQCIDYEDYLHWTGGVNCGYSDLWHTSFDDSHVAAAGGYAFVLTFLTESSGGGPYQSYRLQIVDITDRRAPAIAGTRVLPLGYGSYPQGAVAATGSCVYVASRRLEVIDIADPASPALLGDVELPDWAKDVSVVDDRLYVVGDFGLRVVDIHDPNFPSIVGSLPGVLSSAAAQGCHVYATVGGTFYVIDVRDDSPAIVGVTSASGFVTVQGDYAYLTGDDLTVIDVSDPWAPYVTGTAPLPSDWDSSGPAAVHGDVAYVPTPFHLYAFDVSLRTMPELTGSLIAGHRAAHQVVGSVALGSDGMCFLTFGKGLYLLLADPGSTSPPPIIGEVATESGGDVAVAGDRAFVGSWPLWGPDSPLEIVDLSDPSSPEVLASGDPARCVTAAGDYAYCTRSNGDFYVLHASGTPEIVGSLPLDETAWALAIEGDLVYASSGHRLPPSQRRRIRGSLMRKAEYLGARGGYGFDGRLQVIDVSDRTQPDIVGSVGVGTVLWMDVAVEGNYAYVGCEDGYGYANVRVIDVAEPSSPQVIGNLTASGAVTGVAVAGQHAYVSWFNGMESGLDVVDVSAPGSPYVAGTVSIPPDEEVLWCGVAAQGDVVYVADQGRGLVVIDASEPALPRIVGMSAVGRDDPATSVAIAGNHVVVSGGRSSWSLNVLPLHCEQPVPVLLSGFTAEPQGRAVLLSWFTSFEDMHDGFNVYRSGWLQSGYRRLHDGLIRGRSPYSFLDGSVQPSTTYYYRLGAVDLDGHEVLYGPAPITTPAWGTRTELRLASPSPFGQETELHFSLAAPAEARLAIYDVAGRLVRVLVKEQLPVGDHDATWDGRDDAGLRVAGGTYFVKFTAGDVTQTRKVVFLGGR